MRNGAFQTGMNWISSFSFRVEEIHVTARPRASQPVLQVYFEWHRHCSYVAAGQFNVQICFGLFSCSSVTQHSWPGTLFNILYSQFVQINQTKSFQCIYLAWLSKMNMLDLVTQNAWKSQEMSVAAVSKFQIL